MKQQKKKRNVLFSAVALVVIAALSALGWQWQNTLPLKRIDVLGYQHADIEAIRQLAHVDTVTYLFDVDPALIEDRVRRHPWVGYVAVQRLPTGVLAVKIRERKPVALVLDTAGIPSHYLDHEGHQMPLSPGISYHVPLLRGITEAYHPVRQVHDPVLRQLLEALATAPPELEALISEVERKADGDLWVYTTPIAEQGAIPVRLGQNQLSARLARLQAFWQQSILPQSEKSFRWIDLRFNNQIVTQES